MTDKPTNHLKVKDETLYRLFCSIADKYYTTGYIKECSKHYGGDAKRTISLLGHHCCITIIMVLEGLETVEEMPQRFSIEGRMTMQNIIEKFKKSD